MTVAEMITELDGGLLPSDGHDARMVREVFDAGLIDAEDVRRMYASWKAFG